MQAVQFEQSVVSILQRDQRYDPHAYFFLKDALDFTLKRLTDGNMSQTRHVTGPQLLTGFRDLALEQFGPMASTVMTEWGILMGQNVGDMVFNLIEEQVFGKQDSDQPEDFSNVFDLQKTLIEPFIPSRLRQSATPQARSSSRSKQPKTS